MNKDLKGTSLLFQKRRISTFSSCIALTLFEILIVITIIAIMMLLVGSGLRVAFKTAHGAVNATHHRQIIAALLLYSSEHDGSLPYAYYNDGDQPGAPMKGNKVSYPRLLVYYGYIQNPYIFFSPLAENWYQGNSALASAAANSISPWYYTNYAVNRYGAMPQSPTVDGRHPANLLLVINDGHASQLMLVRDSYNARYDRNHSSWSGGNGGGGGQIWFSDEAYTPPVEKTYNGVVHASFADGRVEAFQRDEIMTLQQSGVKKEAPLFHNVYTRRNH